MNKKDKNKLNEEIKNIESNSLEKEKIKNENIKKNKYKEDIIQLKIELKKCKNILKENQLRSQAEIENIRRRTAIDIEKIYKFSLEKILQEILPVIDNLERTLKSIKNDNFFKKNSVIYEGVNLTLKSLLDVVNKFGIIVIKEKNVVFNPDIHQAMSVIESKNVKKNHVIKIVQKGYTLNGRLLRPAMVIIAK